MKIEIEFTSSYEARLAIDGREMSVDVRPSLYSLKGIRAPETDTTLGGLIAKELYSQVAHFMQAWAAAVEEDADATTWSKLSPAAVEAVENELF